MPSVSILVAHPFNSSPLFADNTDQNEGIAIYRAKQVHFGRMAQGIEYVCSRFSVRWDRLPRCISQFENLGTSRANAKNKPSGYGGMILLSG